MKDGVCYIGDGKQYYESFLEEMNDEWILSNGNMTIQGGIGAGTNGITYVAKSSGKSGSITNNGNGTLTILGSITATTGGHDAYGIEYIAYEAGRGSISNTGIGTLTIQGGAGPGCSGIAYVAKNEGVGTISNTGKGTLMIIGGSGGSASGINNNGEGGTGKIINEVGGTMMIKGGTGRYAYGIWTNGDLRGVGQIINKGDGILTIHGGSGYKSYGIQYNAWTGSGLISNEGSGELTIQGGSESEVYGIEANARGSGSQGTISNAGSGTLTILGGSGIAAHGILHVAEGNGNGTISNGSDGTLNIFGDLNAGTYGIGTLSGTAGDTGTGYLENSGVMNLNKYAIEDFGDGYARVTNHSTGTVYAEVEAIFVKEEGSSSATDSEVGLLNPSDGTNGSTQVEGFGSNGTSVAWNLKEDWANHSVWEEGGTLKITDVVEGSMAAQQIENAFTTQFGTGTELQFLGEDDWASEGVSTAEDTFTASIGNALIDQGYAGQIVTNFNLNNAASDGSAQALTIGTGEGQVIKDSLGFRQVEGVSSVTVNSGKYFALIGLPAGGELIEGGAPVTLNNSMLMLGVTPAESARTDSSTAGTLESVTMKNGSKIKTENMWVQVATIEGQGDVSLTETGRMHVGNMNVQGNVKNAGTLSADNLTVSGSLETSKTLKSSGTIAVDSGSKLVADGYVVAGKLDVKGVMIRGSKANVFTGAAAMDLLREANAEAAAEVDRVEGKAEVSTLSVLERIVAESMKKTEEETTEKGQDADKEDSSSDPKVVTSKRRLSPALPQDAQTFAAFDAVNRIVSDIDAGGMPDGHGLWVKLLTGESEFGVRLGSKFEVDSDGAVIGAEAKLTPDLKVGAAFSYLDGEIDAGRAKSDWKSYGLTAYAHYRAGDFGLKGSAGWLRGTTEAAEDYDADVRHAGVRTEYDLVKGKQMTLTPFLGARLMSGSFDGMESQTVVNVPIGLKLAGELSTAGWTVTPALEASYVRSMGDTESEDVRFLPKNAFTGSLSLKAKKGVWTGELSFRGAAGNNDYEDRAFTAKIGMMF